MLNIDLPVSTCGGKLCNNFLINISCLVYSLSLKASIKLLKMEEYYALFMYNSIASKYYNASY